MMTYEELLQALPDLVDEVIEGRLSPEAEEALLAYPVCQQELDIAVQVRRFLMAFQAEYSEIQIPAGFEARLLARVRAQPGGLELLDLSSKAFVLWLLELFNLLGALLNPSPVPGRAFHQAGS